MIRFSHFAAMAALLGAATAAGAADAPSRAILPGSTQPAAQFICDGSANAPAWVKDIRAEIAEEDDTADVTTQVCISQLGKIEREQVYAVYLQGPLWCKAATRCTLRIYNQRPEGDVYQSFNDTQLDLEFTETKTTTKVGLVLDKRGTPTGIRVGERKLTANPHFFVEAK